MSGGIIHTAESPGFIPKTGTNLVSGVFGPGSFVLSVLFVIALRRRYVHPLSKFPGPFWASVTGLYQCLAFVAGQEHLLHRKLHKTYGTWLSTCLVYPPILTEG